MVILTCWLLAQVLYSNAQEVITIAELPGKSFRGISIFKNTIWVSGSQGTTGRSADGGRSWQWHTVQGFEKTDFRDIEALNEHTAIVMGIASPAFILITTDGGTTWKKVYENNHASIFLDAMAFKNSREGIVVGDPIHHKIFVAETKDGGRTWAETEQLNLADAQPGEAFFAASGTNAAWYRGKYHIVSGGLASRLFIHEKTIMLPVMQGGKMTGANGIAIQGKTILIPAGDYNDTAKKDSAFVYSTNGGKSWAYPQTMPGGYRSSVCFAGKNKAVTCGITGVDISYDNGKNWKNISTTGFNTCAYNRQENAVYFAGNNGRIGKMKLYNSDEK